jgi:hypothetical protein
MTRKDYVAFAQIVKELNEFRYDNVMVVAAMKMARLFAQDNDRFESVRFFDACGINAEQIQTAMAYDALDAMSK